MAYEIGCSKSWVKKWLCRIRSVPLEDQQVLYGLSRTPKRLPPCFSPEVINKVLEIRHHPPRLLGRTPGPLPILYYLHQDQAVLFTHPPHRTPAIYGGEMSGENGFCARLPPTAGRGHDVGELPWVTMLENSTEILNLVDDGSSAVVASEPASDYNAETALRAVAEVLLEQGCPDRIRLDRDTRWVGSWTAKDFP